MKTNKTMIRPMGEFKVLQRTNDGYFNATDLLRQWNKNSGMNKELPSYFKMKSTDELIEEMKKDSDFLNTAKSPYLKSRGRHNGGTWMHPLLFIDFAMWINPKFKLTVLRFIQDELIKYRHEAGDKCKEMCSSILSLDGSDSKCISNVAVAINHIAFGKHESELRQSASQ